MWVVLVLLASPVCGHVAMPGVEVSLHHMRLTIKDADSGLPKLTGSLGVEHQWPDHKHAGFAACKDPPRDSTVCSQNQVARFELGRKEQCYTIRWSALSCSFTPMDCFPLTGASWYGGSETFTQHWPINQQRSAMAPYVAGDIYARQHYGSVLDRYWLSSAGIAIHVENHVPLHVSWNDEGDEKFCLKGSYSGRYYQNPAGKLPHLEYTVCEGSDMIQAHQMLHPMKYKLPTQLPDLRMLKSPIWSTWARYKMHVNENDVMELAREINEHGFSNSQLEIDDKYTPTYGEVSFDRNKFPGGARLVEKLHEMGFRVTTWLTPFVNLESPLFEEGSRAGYFVKDPLGEIPALVKWWQGVGASIDVTNPAAVQWFSDRLRSFQNETGVDSFKFDAGECNWFPPGIQTHVPLENPNDYASEYVGMLATFGGMVETRVGYRSQHHPIFVRMMDKDSV
jgi:alpha-glucosidase (family GH31 glycosyl hydrolase)